MSILVGLINCSSVHDLPLLVGFKPYSISSAVRSNNYYAKSSPIFESGHSE